jgi:hypothetical protein
MGFEPKGQPHEVAMAHDRLYRDGTGNVRAAGLEQVEDASWLLPADSLEKCEMAPINGEPAGLELKSSYVAEPGDVNRTILVYPADRPPTPIQGPNRAARRAAARKRRR